MLSVYPNKSERELFRAGTVFETTGNGLGWALIDGEEPVRAARPTEPSRAISDKLIRLELSVLKIIGWRTERFTKRIPTRSARRGTIITEKLLPTQNQQH